jgi:hypothetical protein
MEELEEYKDTVDDLEDQYDQDEEVQEAQLESYGTVPSKKEQQSIYSWFWKVVRLGEQQKLAKVGNLTYAEIGEHIVSVRDCMHLSVLGSIFGHKGFGRYFEDRAKITSSTSMSKKGWFMDLSISQRKIRERARASAPEQQKWRIFSKKKEEVKEQ